MRYNHDDRRLNNIYATYRYLKRYEGTDYWVKVGIGHDWNTCYMRILSIDDINVIANVIESHFIDDIQGHLAVPADIEALNDEYKYDLYDIELLNEVSVLLTDEIIAILESELMN